MTEMNNIEAWRMTLNLFYEISLTADQEPMNGDLMDIHNEAKSLREKFEEEMYEALGDSRTPEKFLKDIRRSFNSVCHNYLSWYEDKNPSWYYYKEFRIRVNETQTFLDRLSSNILIYCDLSGKHGADYAVEYYEQLKEKLKISDNPTKAVRHFNPKLDKKEVRAVSKKFLTMLKRDGHEYPWRNL